MTALPFQLSLSMTNAEVLEIVARMAPKALRDHLSGSVSRRSHSVQQQDQVRQQEAVPAAVHAGKTDEELLVAYRQGDRVAFATLVERYRADLVHRGQQGSGLPSQAKASRCGQSFGTGRYGGWSTDVTG